MGSLYSVELENVSKYYKSSTSNKINWVLNNVSFKLKKGEILGIIGTNGCGKTTILKIISGILKPNNGVIKISGKVNSIIEIGSGFHTDLTGYENILLLTKTNGIDFDTNPSFVEEIIQFSDIGDAIYEPVKNYSQGMYLRLAFSLAIKLNADLILIDEVLSVGDENFQKKSEKVIKTLAESGKTIVIASHELDKVNKLCSQCLLLDNGEIIKIDNTFSVIKHYKSLIIKNTNKNILPFDYDSIQLINLHFGGNESNIFNSLDEIHINIQYIKKIESETIVCHLDIWDSKGNLILYSSNIFGKNKNEIETNNEKGNYIATITIPSLLLNTGSYRIQLAFSKIQAKEKKELFLFKLMDIIEFDIFDSTDSELILTNTPSLIRTKLNWEEIKI